MEAGEMERINTGIIRSLHESNIILASRPKMPWPDQVLMIEPEFFDVEYVINPHMESMIGSVDKNKAWVEWLALKSQFEKWGTIRSSYKRNEGITGFGFLCESELSNVGRRYRSLIPYGGYAQSNAPL